MRLIIQHPHPKACILACIAMIEDVELETIIEIAGSPAPPSCEVQERIARHFGRCEGYQKHSYRVQHYSELCLAEYMRKHETLLCSVYSCLDLQFAHCVVLHARQLYDPWFGMNPKYDWDKTIMRVSPVPEKKGNQ